jgi:hypothetical protein
VLVVAEQASGGQRARGGQSRRGGEESPAPRM